MHGRGAGESTSGACNASARLRRRDGDAGRRRARPLRNRARCPRARRVRSHSRERLGCRRHHSCRGVDRRDLGVHMGARTAAPREIDASRHSSVRVGVRPDECHARRCCVALQADLRAPAGLHDRAAQLFRPDRAARRRRARHDEARKRARARRVLPQAVAVARESTRVVVRVQLALYRARAVGLRDPEAESRDDLQHAADATTVECPAGAHRRSRRLCRADHS